MAALRRFLLLAALWLVLTANDAAAWLPGLLAAGAGAALSLRLLPPGARHVRLGRLPGLLWHFGRGSLAGGIDVARRSLHPGMPVRPGWIRCSSGLPPGPARLLLADILTLMPGSMAAGQVGDELLVHCIDTRLPVQEDVATLGRRLRGAFGMPAGEPTHG